MRSAEEIQTNLGRVVLLIRGRQATSRRGLAEELNLSATTAGDYVEQLIDQGYVRETGIVKSGPGRPQRSLAALPDAGWFAGVEFNAERVQAVRLDFTGNVTAGIVRMLPPRITSRTILREVTLSIKQLGRSAAGPLLAVGVGAPGVVDPQRGVGVEYAFVEDWHDVPVADTLAARHGVAVTLENNLRAIAYAERWLGGGRQLTDYVILGPRHGFGVAIVAGGCVQTGSRHAAGEVGRWLIGKQQIHHLLSAPAVWRRLTQASAGREPPTDLRRALAKAADRFPQRVPPVVADFADVVGRLHLLLDAQAYFLHGPLTALGPAFYESIGRHSAKVMPALSTSPPVIMASQLGDDAGAIGAGCHAMERWTPTSS